MSRKKTCVLSKHGDLASLIRSEFSLIWRVISLFMQCVRSHIDITFLVSVSGRAIKSFRIPLTLLRHCQISNTVIVFVMWPSQYGHSAVFNHSRETWRYLISISRISPFASWVTSDIWLVPFNSRTAVVTEFIVKNSKKLNFWQFIISLLVNIFWM